VITTDLNRRDLLKIAAGCVATAVHLPCLSMSSAGR
jgi:hypothetical protein